MVSKKVRKVPRQIIHSFGLFWHANEVFWGVGSNKGALWGWGVRSQGRPGIVNFREQIGVYVLYDDFKPIYVGQAGFGKQKQNLLRRLRQHQNDNLAGRWNRFSWFGTRWVTKSGKLSSPTDYSHPAADVVLDQVEAILITTIEPGLNRQGGKWRRARRYDQMRDPRLGETDRHMLKRLLKHQNLTEEKKLEKSWEKLLVP